MKILKKLIAISLGLSFMAFAALAWPSTVMAQAQPIGLMINGQRPDNLPSPPVIRNDRMLVPARAVFETLGATVGWNPDTRVVYIQYNDNNLRLTIGQTSLIINEQTVAMPVAAQIINGRTMIPIAAVGTSLGFSVDFRDRTVFIDTIVPEPEPELELDPVYTQNADEDVDEKDYAEYDYDNSDYYTELCEDQLSEDDGLDPIELPPTPPTVIPPVTGQIAPARDVSTSVIQTVDHPATTIVSVNPPMASGQQIFTIVASSAISGVERTLLEDNRLVLDIPNSTTLVSGAIPVPPSLAVRALRASQHAATTSRVVLELQPGTEFRIDLNAERTVITITINNNTLTDVSFVPGAAYDAIVLTGVSPAIISTQPITGHLNFHMANTMAATSIDTAVQGNFASHLRLSQVGEHALTLSVAVNTFATAHSIVQTGPNETTIRLQNTSFQNIDYDFETRTFRIPKSSGTPLNITAATRFDMYHQHQFVLALSMDASAHLGTGEVLIGDPLVRSMTLNHTAGGTQLIFNGNQIFTLDVQEDAEHYTIRIMHPRERYQRIVVLDPGHGGRQPGVVRDGIRESDMVLQVTQKLLQLIEADGFIRAYTTRNSDVYVSLADRARLGNNTGDLFLSIHINSSTNIAAHGIETYFRANSLDNFRSLTSRNFADIIHRNKLVTLGSNDRGVRTANFVVLRYSTIPAVLVELGFMSNAAERERITGTEFQWQAARALYNGLLEAFLHLPTR